MEYDDKKVQVNMKMSRSLHEAAQEKAAEENRSFSNYVATLIMVDLKNVDNKKQN